MYNVHPITYFKVLSYTITFCLQNNRFVNSHGSWFRKTFSQSIDIEIRNRTEREHWSSSMNRVNRSIQGNSALIQSGCLSLVPSKYPEAIIRLHTTDIWQFVQILCMFIKGYDVLSTLHLRFSWVDIWALYINPDVVLSHMALSLRPWPLWYHCVTTE